MTDLIKQYKQDLKGFATHSIAWRILNQVIQDLEALESTAAPKETKITAPSNKKKAGN